MNAPPGTIRRRSMAVWQWIIMLSIWILPIVGYSLWMANNPPSSGSDGPAWVFLAIIGVSTVFAIGVGVRGHGKERIWITEAEGVRGEFRLYRPFLLAMIPFCIMVTVMTTALLLEEETISGREWAAALIVYLGFLVLPPFALLRGIHALRVEDDGSLWYRRLGGWYPFRIEDYGQIRNTLVRGRYGGSAPSGVRLCKPLAGLRPVSLNLLFVRSRLYGTTVPTHVMEQFFITRCKRAGYTLTQQDDGTWVATPPGKPRL